MWWIGDVMNALFEVKPSAFASHGSARLLPSVLAFSYGAGIAPLLLTRAKAVFQRIAWHQTAVTRKSRLSELRVSGFRCPACFARSGSGVVRGCSCPCPFMVFGDERMNALFQMEAKLNPQE